MSYGSKLHPEKKMLTPNCASEFFRHMVEESVHVQGEEIKAIRHAAKKTGMVVSVGVSEKIRTATLFNSNLIIAPDGEITVHHRKLVPTFYEKLTWSPGDGSGLRIHTTPSGGKIGALICGENTNPLARYALMALGEQVHISSWPAIWPTRRSKSEKGKANGPPPENYDNVAANYIRSAAHCFEAKCFGISCAGHFSKENIDEILRISGDTSCLSTLRQTPRAASMFLGPTGSLHPSFTIDEHTGTVKAKKRIQDEEDILFADLDLADCVEGKQYHDVTGGYQRLDVFDLRVDRSRKPPVSTSTPKAMRDAFESATMFTPDNSDASIEGFGARRPSGLPWQRSRTKEISLNDEDTANRVQTRNGNLPTEHGVTDDSLDLMQGMKEQEATSDGAPGARPERTPMEIRYTFQPDRKD